MSNKINLYYDARMLNHSGIGTQIEEVIPELYFSKDINLHLIGDKKKIQNHFSFFPVNNIVEFNAPIYSLQEQLFYPKIPEHAFYHFPHYNAPIKYLNKSFVVIHDLIHLDSEEFKKPHYRLYSKTIISKIVKNAKAIITVSEYTKKRLFEEFSFYKDNIYVIHNGINKNIFFPATKKEIYAFRKKWNLPEKYFLVVGIAKKHKNLDGLLLALKDLWLKRELKIPPLVIAGTYQKIPDYIKDIYTEDIKPYVYFLPYIPKEELRILYSSSYGFIMPSKLEGFGFPLLEAMACGVPTISSKEASLPEIAGNATYYFNPYSIKDMQNAILTINKNQKLYKELIKKGFEQVKKFEWKTHVKKLIEIYKIYY